MKLMRIHILSFLLANTVFFSCSPNVDPPTPDPAPLPLPPDKPVSSLAMMVYQKNGKNPIPFDTIRIKYDSIARLTGGDIPFFKYNYQGELLKQARIQPDFVSALPIFHDYLLDFDGTGRPVSGNRSFSVSYSVPGGPSIDHLGTTTTDSIQYTTIASGQLSQVVFFNRVIVDRWLAPFKDTTIVKNGMVESYSFSYNADSSISKVHTEWDTGEKWDIEYSYGSGKSPMLRPAKNTFFPDNLFKRSGGSDYLMVLSMAQARHEIIKIRIINIVSGEVGEISFTYTLRQDGYPDFAIVKETGTISKLYYNPWSSDYKLKFLYNN